LKRDLELAHILYLVVLAYSFIGGKKEILKSKKIQLAQIFKLSFRSLKNQEAVKILLCDCNPNFF